MVKYIGIYLFSVFISAISQILLKLSAQKNHKDILHEYLNPYVIGAYAIFFCSSILTIIAYRRVPWSMGPIIESVGYVFVTILGYFCLHETIGRKKAMGLACILIGIAIAYI